MSDRDPEAALAQAATAATLRAVMTVLSMQNRELFTAIQAAVQGSTSAAVPDGDQAQRNAVAAKAQRMYFSQL